MRLKRLLPMLAVAAAGALAVAVMESLAGVAEGPPPCAGLACPGGQGAATAAGPNGAGRDPSTEAALLRVAEAKLDSRIVALDADEQRLRGRIQEQDAARAAELDRLTKVYEDMSATAAAARLALLPPSMRLSIAAGMRPRALSAVLAAMSPAAAESLTEAMAAQGAPQREPDPPGA